MLQKRSHRTVGISSQTEMKELELLRLLFEAHRDNNDELFQHAAQSIIARELSANRHSEAQRLVQALGRNQGDRIERHKLSRLPSRTAPGTDLVTIIHEPRLDRDPVLADVTRQRVERLILEHRERVRLAEYGLHPKRTALFWGPPGCGKTMTASYIARELQMPLGILNLAGIVSSLLGGTAAQLQSVFSLAESRPIVLLLDEFDTLAKERDDERDIGESKRIVNSLLQLIERFHSSKSLILAASNHQYVLDRAIWRRFDDIVPFPLPTEAQRRNLLRDMLSGVAHVGSIIQLAKTMSGLSFADISLILIESLRTMVLEQKKMLLLDEVKREATRYMKARSEAILRKPARTPSSKKELD
jgi:SpoVK/Ycf46/Vps4 family AAA+-type ATPase